MSELIKKMGMFSAAEEFLDFFGIEYDQEIVDINRLHILKRFNQYLRGTPGTAQMDDISLGNTCKGLLTRAYQDFVRSTPAQEKVFKVFQDQDGQSVTLNNLRLTLPSQQKSSV